MVKDEPSKIGLYIINSRQHLLRVMFKVNIPILYQYLLLLASHNTKFKVSDILIISSSQQLYEISTFINPPKQRKKLNIEDVKSQN